MRFEALDVVRINSVGDLRALPHDLSRDVSIDKWITADENNDDRDEEEEEEKVTHEILLKYLRIEQE